MSDTPLYALEQATARIERIIYIPGALSAGEDCFPDDFDEFWDNLGEANAADLTAALPQLSDLVDSGAGGEELFEALWQVPGFLVQAATPVFQDVSLNDKGEFAGGSYSWGHYYTAWLYAADEASIVTVVTAWARAKQAARAALAAAEASE